MAQARSARAINRVSVTYGTDREDKVSKIFTIYISILCLKGSGTIFIPEDWLQISEAGRKQNRTFGNRF